MNEKENKKTGQKINSEEETLRQNRLLRSESDKIIAGVAGGIGNYFAIDPTIIRITFIILTVFGGSGLLIYVLLWLIVPSSSSMLTDSGEVITENLGEVKEKTKEFAQHINTGTKKDDSRMLWGVLLFVFGIVFLLQNFGLFDIIRFSRLWPLILIVAGAFLLTRQNN